MLSIASFEGHGHDYLKREREREREREIVLVVSSSLKPTSSDRVQNLSLFS
jgi:hypothetical protein